MRVWISLLLCDSRPSLSFRLRLHSIYFCPSLIDQDNHLPIFIHCFIITDPFQSGVRGIHRLDIVEGSEGKGSKGFGQSPPRPAVQQGPGFAHRNYTESVHPHRSLDCQPELHASVPNAILSLQIRDNLPMPSNASSLGTSSAAVNTAPNYRNTALTAVDDTEPASAQEHVETAHAYAAQRRDHRI